MKRIGLVLMVVFILINNVLAYEGYRGYTGYTGYTGYNGYLSREQKAALVKAAVDSFFAVQERKAEAERLRLAEIERQKKEAEERQRQQEETERLAEQNIYQSQAQPLTGFSSYTAIPNLTTSNFSYRYNAVASFYSEGNPRTANGEFFNPDALTAAHKTLPFGTLVRVTNRYNGKSIIVRINDRGPYIRGREIDLTLGAAKELEAVNTGVFPVMLEILSLPAPYRNWPTPSYYGITSKFHAWRGWRFHQGVDIRTPNYLPVRPITDGIVSYAGWQGNYGLVINVKHLNGLETRYGHLSRIYVRYGQIVDQSTVLGLTGETGNSTGPHLHYEVRYYGRPINPLTLR